MELRSAGPSASNGSNGEKQVHMGHMVYVGLDGEMYRYIQSLGFRDLGFIRFRDSGVTGE